MPVTNLNDYRPQRGILIQPTVHTDTVKSEHVMIIEFTEVKLRSSKWQDINKFLGCTTFTGCGYPDAEHCAYTDDEAVLTMKPSHPYGCVLYSWMPQPIIGNVLVCGFDITTGYSTGATIEIDHLKASIQQSKVVFKR